MELVNDLKYYNKHMKKCIDNYRRNHRDELNEKRRENYRRKCAEDPEYREKLRQNARKQHAKKKALKDKAKNDAVADAAIVAAEIEAINE